MPPFSGTFNENVPSTPVVVPIVVPFSLILTPGRPSPFEITFPEIGHVKSTTLPIRVPTIDP